MSSALPEKPERTGKSGFPGACFFGTFLCTSKESTSQDNKKLEKNIFTYYPFSFQKKSFYSPSLRAQRTGARKGIPGGILIRALRVRFQGLHNSLRSDMVQSFVSRGFTVTQFVPEIHRAARGFLIGKFMPAPYVRDFL